MTAAHVVQTADRVAVEFANGMSVPARVIASEVRADVALLQLERVPPVPSLPGLPIRTAFRLATTCSSSAHRMGWVTASV